MADPEERLLGYLLEALDDSEREQLEEQLADDPVLQHQLECLQEALEPLDATRASFEPPEGLAERTCQMVAQSDRLPETAADVDADAPSPRQLLDDRHQSRVREQGRRTLALAGVANDPAPGPAGWSWKDLVVTAAIFIAATLLLLPAIENSRFHSRLETCQDNLRVLGQALAQYSEQHEGYFPVVPRQGNLAAAGVFAPILADEGYLENPRWVVCPDSHLADQRQFDIPPLDALRTVDNPAQLERLQNRMGGSYGYCLGFVEDGRYRSPRNMRRAAFAIMSDAPSDQLPGHQTLNHGGRGQNVLFEDLHVQFFTTPKPNDAFDHFFVNDRGQVAAGRHRNDSVIGQSASPPVQYVRWAVDSSRQ